MDNGPLVDGQWTTCKWTMGQMARVIMHEFSSFFIIACAKNKVAANFQYIQAPSFSVLVLYWSVDIEPAFCIFDCNIEMWLWTNYHVLTDVCIHGPGSLFLFFEMFALLFSSFLLKTVPPNLFISSLFWSKCVNECTFLFFLC